jgi:hypothetical protein
VPLSEDSLQDIEEVEKWVVHRIDLLNQADQSLKQETIAFDRFIEKHPELKSKTSHIADAIKEIESVLLSLVAYNNTLQAMVREFHERAKTYDPTEI